MVEYDPTELGSRYAEARQRGVGVEPGAGANSKLLRDATRGPSNPFADLGKFISGLFKKK